MIKLHRERVLEEIAPQRLCKKEPRRVRHEPAIDQRPGVVDVAGAQSGDERAEINLPEHQDEQRNSRRANSRGRRLPLLFA